MDNDNERVAQILGYGTKKEEVKEVVEETKVEVVEETKEIVEEKPIEEAKTLKKISKNAK